MLIYLRKITSNDTKKQIETTSEAYMNFFGGDESNPNGVEVVVCNLEGNDNGVFRISKAGGNANSYRFASRDGTRGFSKFLLDNYNEYAVGDILKIEKNKHKYIVSIINKDDYAYESLSSLFQPKQNTIIVMDTDTNDDANTDCIQYEYNIQRIYFGAPGTGKSYGVDRLISKCYPNINIKDNPFVFRTTVYSDYSYYNFIGNIMPTSKDGEIGYEFKAGVFAQALAMAFEHIDKEIFLVIEEMSRGDIASIFGDIFQLLDRDDSGISDYSINNDLVSNYLNEKNIDIGEKIYLPRNLHIIGTVNTSDQNVNVIDTAFKRRFEFVYVDVNPVKDDNDKFLNSFTFKLDDTEFEWNRFYMSLNELITTKLELSEDKQIGQFFIKFNNLVTDEQKLDEIKNKLLHYLWDDVQGAVISDECSIFKNEYKTFSSLYKAFGNGENVFSSELMTIYTKKSI